MSRKAGLFAWGVVIAALGVTAASAAGTAGSTDVDFDGDGVLEVAADRIVSDGSGRIVVADRFVDGSGDQMLRVRRYATDGRLDPTFQEVSLFGNPSGAGTSGVSDLGIDAQGRVVLAARRALASVQGKGRKAKTVYQEAFVVRRYENDGTLDTGFGSSGEVVMGYFTQSDAFSGIADLVVLGDDSVLVVGDGPVPAASSGGGSNKGRKGSTSSSSRGIVVARLDAYGDLDGSYGAGGYGRFDLDPASDADILVRGTAMQSDGSVLILAGGGGVSFGLTRLDPGGAHDLGFGDAGRILPASGLAHSAVATDRDDRIYLSSFDLQVEVRITRYNADGALGVGVGLPYDWTALRGLHVGEDASGNPMVYAVCSLIDANGSTGSVFPVRLREDGQGVLEVDPSYGPRGDGTGDWWPGASDAPDSALSFVDNALVIRINPDPSPRVLWRLCGDS